MRQGVWHQMGDRSQRLVLEQAKAGVGVGAIMSPRDLAPHLVRQYADQYRKLGMHVAIDPQFHVVEHTVGRLKDWPYNDLRTSVSHLKRIGEQDLAQLAAHLTKMNADAGSSAVIAPALIYETGRADIVDANRRLFRAARRAAKDLGVPTWGTVVIGRSAAATERTLQDALSSASSLPADAWYFAVEFDGVRLPNDEDQVFRAADALLTLAAGGRPVLQGFAGPTGLLGVAAGATAVTVGHAQNLWQVPRGRLQPPAEGGGGGDAPPRLFSRELWGTIVYRDEVALIPEELAKKVVEESRFATPLSYRDPFPELSRWDAGKHLVWLTGVEFNQLYELGAAAKRCEAVIRRLEGATKLHRKIREGGIALKDDTDSYQGPWLNALNRLRKDGAEHYRTIELLR